MFLGARFPLHLIFVFPLVGGGNRPASPATLLAGLSVASDDNEFENVSLPDHGKETEPTKTSPESALDCLVLDDDDNENLETIIENEVKNSPRVRQNSIPTSIHQLKHAILNGIAAGNKNETPLTYLVDFLFFSLSLSIQPVCCLFTFKFSFSKISTKTIPLFSLI